jgi:hypothetical protein
MAVSQQKSPSWQDEKVEEQRGRGAEEKQNEDLSQIPNSSTNLPCLESSNECVDKLTESAIALSNKLKHLDEKIALIDDRLKVVDSRIDYVSKKGWTNYVTIDPVKLLQNIFGGGDIQKDRIASADLEIKTADLEAAKAELERQKEEEKTLLGEKVLRLVLDYEKSDRAVALVKSQLQTFALQNQVFYVQYKFGQNTTEKYLNLQDRSDRLNEQLTDAQTRRYESIRELSLLTGKK